MKAFSKTLQVVVAILLSLLILLQQRGTGLGAGIAGGSGGEFYATKRGAEKVLARITVFLAAVFCINALIYPFLNDSTE